jgi:hypothetical protein
MLMRPRRRFAKATDVAEIGISITSPKCFLSGYDL